MKLITHIRSIGRICLGSAAITLLSGMIASCSSNVEPGLYAAGESNIKLSVTASGFENGLLKVGSAQAAAPFTVTATTRWIVDVTDCEGAWCQIIYGDTPADKAGHIGDGYFYIETAANRTQEIRKCLVTVYAIERDGTKVPGKSIEINIEQDGQSIDVDYPSYIISAFGTNPDTEPLVRVTANQAWVYTCSHPWITVIPGAGLSEDGFTPAEGSSAEVETSFRIKVAPNPGTSVRFAEIVLSSPTWSFTPIRLNVTQEGSTETFFLTPSNVPVVSYEGDMVEFKVYSPHDAWTIQPVEQGNWLTLDRTSGDASADPVTVQAMVAPNSSPDAREAKLVLTRESDMTEVVVTLTQQGNARLPVLSSPWLVDGWSAELAELHAYYLAPLNPVTGCGAYVRSANGDTREYTGEANDDLITVFLSDLRPHTMYEAQLYLTYTIDGEETLVLGKPVVFTTPGSSGGPGTIIPNPGDNTPPSSN